MAPLYANNAEMDGPVGVFGSLGLWVFVMGTCGGSI